MYPKRFDLRFFDVAHQAVLRPIRPGVRNSFRVCVAYYVDARNRAFWMVVPQSAHNMYRRMCFFAKTGKYSHTLYYRDGEVTAKRSKQPKHMLDWKTLAPWERGTPFLPVPPLSLYLEKSGRALPDRAARTRRKPVTWAQLEADIRAMTRAVQEENRKRLFLPVD